MPNTTKASSLCTGDAIHTAANYTLSSKTDWHLPSKSELNQLYIQRSMVGGFFSGYYWSSSEFDANGAWSQDFGGGGQDYGLKGTTYYVRPVRAFG
jgi:hypothetical protein